MLVEPKAVNAKHSVVPNDALSQVLESVIAIYASTHELSFSEKANFADTIARAHKAWAHLRPSLVAVDDLEAQSAALSEMHDELASRVQSKSSIHLQLSDILSTGFPMESHSNDAGIITQGPIESQSLCPHHLLPVTYEVYVAYRPVSGGAVLGLSKLARVAKLLAERPVLQEQYTADVADALHYDANNETSTLAQIMSSGSAVQVVGHHSCMSCRGVECDAYTLTTALRGCFHTADAKAEFYQAVAAIKTSTLTFVSDEKLNF